jgi:hypothetical protein
MYVAMVAEQNGVFMCHMIILFHDSPMINHKHKNSNILFEFLNNNIGFLTKGKLLITTTGFVMQSLKNTPLCSSTHLIPNKYYYFSWLKLFSLFL